MTLIYLAANVLKTIIFSNDYGPGVYFHSSELSQFFPEKDYTLGRCPSFTWNMTRASKRSGREFCIVNFTITVTCLEILQMESCRRSFLLALGLDRVPYWRMNAIRIMRIACETEIALVYLKRKCLFPVTLRLRLRHYESWFCFLMIVILTFKFKLFTLLCSITPTY